MINMIRFHSQRIKLSTLLLAFGLLAGIFLPSRTLTAANRTAAPLGGGANLVAGGTFETPALPASPGYQYNPSGSNWTFVGGAGFSRNGTGFTSGNPNAPQGAQVLFLQGTGRATQNITFVAGFYDFSLFAAQRGNHQASSQTVEIRIDGSSILSVSPSGTNYQAFNANAVYISSGVHAVQLRGINPNGGDNTAFLDDFKVVRVQEQFISGFESPALPVSPGYQYGPSGGPWTFGSGGGLSRNGTGFTSGNPNAPEGNQVLFLQQGGSASHPITISQSGFYRFKFKAALRGNNMADGEVKNIRMTLAGYEIGEFSIPSINYTELTSLSIYLSPGTYTLQLRGINPVSGDHTGLVDDLRMERIHDWQDAYVWGGTVPNSNDNATIPAGSAVGVRGSVNANRIIVHGELLGAQNQNVEVFAKNIMIMNPGAQMQFGQDLAPYPSNAHFTLMASASDPAIGAMGNNFIGAMNEGTLHFHGPETVSWSQLGANAVVGANTITLKEKTGWAIGDEIVIVSSRLNWNEAEKRTITNINGPVITLNQTLNYPHTGVIKNYTDGSRNWTADLRAQVGRLSRNIKVEGNAASAASGYGGHIMIMDNSKAYVGGIELYNMGQKAILGKYPFHWHMLGDVGQGQYFKNSAVHQSYNRAITIHGTESTLVENNFFYDHIGHGVFLEDGSERFNVIRKNVTLLTKRPAPGEELTPSDNELNQVQNRTPSSYWITNPQNTFEDNVAAGTQGTGYWFAFPTSPMGASATDPRFQNLQPHTLPMISFARNSAHSCMSGFDIFDQLNPDHSLKTNWGWAENSDHVMNNCLWYANDLALYSGIGVGGPSDNLIFRNNVFVENKVGVMFASFSIVDESAIVANSGENLYGGQQYAYRVYDGAGQVHNSHFIGWNASDANFLLNTGAATKHPNHILTGNTTDHTGFVRCVLPNFDVPPATAGANDPEHPRYWSIVLKDVDGGITQKANTSLVCNHPFVLVGDEFQPSTWTRAYRSDHHFALSLLSYGLPSSSNPNIVATRTKAGTSTESVYYVDGFKEHHQLPFIVNEGYQYTYTYESLPTSKRVYMYMKDAVAGDDYLVKYTDFGKLGGLSIASTQGAITSHSSLSSLNAATSSGYYLQSGGDLYIKPVATGLDQRFTITWSTNFAVPVLDTDGDQMADGTEISNGRHPFTSADLAAEFTTNGDFEGWTTFNNISGASVTGGSLTGTSINNGDAMVINNDYNFNASEVPYLKVRMKASANSGVEFFFATNTAPGYSGTRRVSASYTGNGAWQELTFNMGGHASWNGVITNLRFDVVSGVGKTFEVDWIRASGTAKQDGFAGDELTGFEEVKVYPNPFENRLSVEWGDAGAFQRLDLVDVQGKVVRSVEIPAGAARLDWSLADAPLSPGLYGVRLSGVRGVEVVKVVRMR